MTDRAPTSGVPIFSICVKTREEYCSSIFFTFSSTFLALNSSFSSSFTTGLGMMPRKGDAWSRSRISSSDCGWRSVRGEGVS